MRRAVGHGELFPAWGRIPPQEAPGGTTETTPKGNPLRRLQQEHRWFQHVHHIVPTPNLGAPITLLHLTDIHLRTCNDWLDQLCENIRHLHPDAVVITGDVVTKGWKRAAVDQFLQAIPDAPLGKFAVMGNWEHWAGAPVERWEPILVSHGIELLTDEWRDLGDFVLCGTQDKLTGQPDILRSLEGRPANKPTVVLTHSPSIFPELYPHNIDLVLAGHSHGGQVRLPKLGAVWTPNGTDRFVAGWYHEQGTHMFVSRGIGWSIAPVRMWCTPEIAHIQMNPLTGQS